MVWLNTQLLWLILLIGKALFLLLLTCLLSPDPVCRQHKQHSKWMQDTRNSHHVYANMLSKQVYLCPKTDDSGTAG